VTAMTFINWSDSEEMLGLLSEYVADERNDSAEDDAREAFLTGLSTELAELTAGSDAMSAEEVSDRLRAIHRSHADDFPGDPVLIHVEACIEELERIRREGAP
jgi:pyruvoyl-dependent arginine decarboxylase (PvlArgDC)